MIVLMHVVVGRIGKAHGVRGEVSVEVRTDAPEIRFAPGAVLATDPPSAGPLKVAEARRHHGRLLLSFDEVADRSTAESLRGVLLLAEVADDERPDDPDEFYDHQLAGLAVVTTRGRHVGDVAEVLHLPSQDLLAVRTADGREVLIPFVAQIVPSIDLEARRVVVDPPPGLIDAES
jgi:16S rRNA processing protein RimM